MRMIRILQGMGVCLLLVLGTAAVRADDPSTTFVGVLAIANDEAVARQLGLSDETRAALTSLIEKRESDATELVMQASSMSAEEKAAKVKAFREESEKLGLKMLSDSQRKQLDRIRLQKTGLASLADPAIATQLKLTAEQQAEIAKLITERDATIAKATPSQRKMFPGYYEKKIGEVITKEQRTQWEQLAGGSEAPSSIAAEGTDSRSASNGASAGGKAADATTTASSTVKGNPKANKDTALKRTEDGKLLFNFQFQPWKDVLDWYAQQADLSLVLVDVPPAGTFNYQDNEPHTISEAFDIFNKILQTRDYTLIRNGRMLMVLSTKEGVPANLVPTVAVEDLPNHAKTEVVKVILPVSRLTPEDAASVVNSQVSSSVGKVVVMAPAKQLLVTETAGQLLTIKKVLDQAENPQIGGFSDLQVEVYPITSADPDSVLQVMQTLLAGQPDVRLKTDPKTGYLIALAHPSQHRTIRATLDQLQRDGRKVDVIQLRSMDPQVAVQMIKQMFGGEKDESGSSPKVDAEPTLRRLLVRGTDAQVAQIKAMVAKMEGPESEITGISDRGNIRIIPLSGRQSRSALEQLEQLWPATHQNSIRVVTPSGGYPEIRSGGASSISIPQGPGIIDERRPSQVPTSEERTPSSSLQHAPLPQRDSAPAAKAGPVSPSGVQSRDSIKTRAPAIDNSTRSMPSNRSNDGSNSMGQLTIERLGGPLQIDVVEPLDALVVRGNPRNVARVVGPSNAQPHRAQKSATAAPDKSTQAVAASRFQLVSQTSDAADQPSTNDQTPTTTQPAETQSKTAAPNELKTDHAAPNRVDLKAAATESDENSNVAKEKSKDADKASIPGAPIVVVIGASGIMIASEDKDALNEFEKLLATLTSKQIVGQREYTVFYLKHSKAATAAVLLQQIFGGGTVSSGGNGSLVGDIAQQAIGGFGGGFLGGILGGGNQNDSIVPAGVVTGARGTGGPVDIIPDSRLNALFVQASPADVDTIDQLLHVLDQPDSPEDVALVPKPRLIYVNNTTADAVADVVKQVYSNRLEGAAGQNQPFNPAIMFQQALRGGRGGRGGDNSRKNPRKCRSASMSETTRWSWLRRPVIS